MAPPKASKQSKKRKTSVAKPKKESTSRLTLEELDAISSDDDDDEYDNAGADDDNSAEWNAEALALRQAIKEGAFDRLLSEKGDDNQDESADELEEASLDDDSDEGSDEEQERENDEEENIEQDEEDEDEEKDGSEHEKVEEEKEQSGDDDASSSSDDENVATNQRAKGPAINRIALASITEEMVAAKRDIPWAETFCIIPPTPLPFDNPKKKRIVEMAAASVNTDDDRVDVHDDLKRELAFYNMALEAVGEAKVKCKESGVPFSRPIDFFAEMVKTDDHMAKVKDRLIFETKKIEAVVQRKANKEQKLRSRETRDNKVAEKAKRKREHQRAVDDWAKTAAASSQSGVGEDSKRSRFSGPNKKRLAADRKYGHGGKRGLFKQNDRKSLDDMSSFNPRGNFSGGTKRSASEVGGHKRPGQTNPRC